MMNTVNKKLSIVLVASLVLNLFLLGVGTGIWATKHHGKGGFHQAFKNPPKDLSPELTQHFKQRHKDMRQNFKQARQIRKQLHTAMTAPELDITQVKTLFEQLNEIKQRNISESQQTMIQALEQMSYEQRLEFAEQLKRKKRPPRFR